MQNWHHFWTDTYNDSKPFPLKQFCLKKPSLKGWFENQHYCSNGIGQEWDGNTMVLEVLFWLIVDNQHEEIFFSIWAMKISVGHYGGHYAG